MFSFNFRSGIVKNASWLIVGKIYRILINLVISMISARYLGPSNYGLINYAASFTALFTAISDLGTNGILVNEFVRNPNETGRILGSTIVFRLLSSTMSLITIVLLAALLNPGDSMTVWVVFIYSTTLIVQSFESIDYWYQSKLMSKRSTIIAAIGYTAAAIYKVILLVAKMDVKWFAASHALECGLVVVLLLFTYKKDRDYSQHLSFSLSAGKDILKQSYHFIPSGLMVAVYGQIDKIMLKQMIGAAEVGYYAAAATISGMWAFVLSAIIDSVKPGIYRAHNDRQEELYKSRLKQLYSILIYLSVFAAIGISLLSKLIILILYGEEFILARYSLHILCWSTLFSYLGVARTMWLVPNGKQKYEKYIAASGAVCNMILNAVLIPRWGITGASFATLITQIFTNFIVGFLIKDIRENNMLIIDAVPVWRHMINKTKG